ncbi:hypothetical protein PPERSA_09787 [Pseudocohnilembus persalinus]|uniref:Uncharacterized protein n=1 Tax=Pseudocohnilembus persalinus TaxID=266149 RepID=A0A0V0QTN0_PSEPJ|nr:hypothetical protein PPERSA_09787 [Pseudocohnilembus persalinus]|eukprot:KRX05647.1 hypothetical protein PPERSA_09787 [Pseudocohnilembus persalinus]
MINQKRNHSSKFDQLNNQKNQRNNQKSKIKIKYQGFIPKKDWKIDTVESDICPQLFFEKYVKQRQPVLINNSKNNQMTQFSWNKDYMSKKAGNTEVFIEKRDAEYECNIY